MSEPEEFGEREKSAVAALVEEYKARLSQIIAFDNEINRWSASYIIALVVGIGWTLSSQNIKTLSGLFLEDSRAPNFNNCYFMLSLAVINALYILWLTIKGYQAQQLHFYLHTVTGKQIRNLIDEPYNSFEIWRRSTLFCSKRREGKLDWRRTFFYLAFTLLPFGVSFSVLWMYGQFVWNNNAIEIVSNGSHLSILLNVIYVFVIVFHIVVAYVAISTSSFNKFWEKTAKIELIDESRRSVAPYVLEVTRMSLITNASTETQDLSNEIITKEVKGNPVLKNKNVVDDRETNNE